MKYNVEVCAGSVEDCIKAQNAQADRIELNNGLYLGGLTPSYATLKLAKAKVKLPIISMVRPRGGGFYYNDIEIETMFEDARQLLELGSDGLAFGFLNEDRTIDTHNTQLMVDLCHQYDAEAVFHRAFDMVEDPHEAIQLLIACGVDRILTSGCQDKAPQGAQLLKELQAEYGDKIELLMGSGINQNNVAALTKETGIYQVHASFKTWYKDSTTSGESVTYAYSNLGDYDGVDQTLVESLIDKLKGPQ